MTEMCTPNGGLINPAMFPVPTADPGELETLAGQLRTAGETVSGIGADIKSGWGGLSGNYTAPETETLLAAVDSVVTDGDAVESSTGNAATALETFAESVRDIKSKWATLTTDSNTFLNSIDTSNDDWKSPDRFSQEWWFGGEAPKVAEHQRLLDRADELRREYEQAERDCANGINADVANGTDFVPADGSGGPNKPGEYQHGFDGYLGDVDMAWGGSQSTDHGWWVDAGSAVKDFSVGVAEDVGGFLGIHNSEGWFQGSWGSNLWEYHEGNLQSAASLVGMYDAENDSWGFQGWDRTAEIAGGAWKDAAHAVVPWEEWGERPGYVIGTALLNIGATVAGVALSATGVGAVVGAPLLAWRGSAMLNKMGGDGPSVSTPDMPEFNLGNLNLRLPGRFGGGDSPTFDFDMGDLDTSSFSPSQLGEMRAALDRINGDNSGGAGSPDGTPDNRRVTPVNDDADADRGSRPRDGDPTADQLQAMDDFQRIVENPDNADFGRNVTQRHQADIDEVDRNAKTSPGREGSWEGNDIESDRPDLDGDRSRVPVTPRGDTMEADRPRDTSPEDVYRLTGTGPQDFDTRPGGDLGSGGPDMRDRTPAVTNSVDNGNGNGGDAPNGGDTGNTRPVTGDGDSGGSRSGTPGSPDFHGGSDGHSGGGSGSDGNRGDGDGSGDSGGNGDNGGNGDGRRPPSPTNLEEFENHTWGDKDDPANQQAFRDDLQRLLNEDQNGRAYNDFFKEYYKENNGHRKHADTYIGPDLWKLPQISRVDSNSPWVPLEAAEPPKPLGARTEMRLDNGYFSRTDLTTEELTRRDRLRTGLNGLDNLAHDRRVSINASMRARDHLAAMEDLHGEWKKDGPNHEKVAEAKKTYQDAQSYATRIAEDFGEETARIGARHEFNGTTLRDGNGDPVMRHVVDERGRTVRGDDGKPLLTEHQPDLNGAEEIKPSEFAPGNGNDQFDQVYRTRAGEIVIVEAKSSTKTELSERTVTGDGTPRRVSQGTRAYLEDILDAMEKRGVGDNAAEADLAQEIRRKLRQGRVTYSSFKGDPVDVYRRNDNGTYVKDADGKREWTGNSHANGYDHQIFDISKKEAS
ncbi:hypothetical protein Q8791_03055 [Nocardiopsis sp. CT-R113]|uniref:Uncharacterized protein n=2 Tax=Nocardiopsis codii TaxID=3065942 RepID=A0ABU7K1S3_9ACTN|nr:hypothetical protein [Nocardiopsis sp. CT-R113]MEE2036199.1 hypothetical protein [Nocardiopsis sp. CT-R113]